jgi:hypothetical protein
MEYWWWYSAKSEKYTIYSPSHDHPSGPDKIQNSVSALWPETTVYAVIKYYKMKIYE